MRLYLDLNKALSQVSATGVDHKSGERAAEEHKESFSRDHTGVSGGDPSTDKPEVGGKWSHSSDEDDSKTDNEILKDKPVAKAQDSIDILKSLTRNMHDHVSKALPNEREVEYLTQECDYNFEDVVKGRARITGYERAKFNRWLNQRLQSSISRLYR